ncbi:hypothetical protein HanPI659440_Chr15g0579241 [Helianthus annuus]|nr:hypothetical protein HanPI659440_Chr15g0579241 [Helianthus annuus]
MKERMTRPCQIPGQEPTLDSVKLRLNSAVTRWRRRRYSSPLCYVAAYHISLTKVFHLCNHSIRIPLDWLQKLI